MWGHRRWIVAGVVLALTGAAAADEEPQVGPATQSVLEAAGDAERLEAIASSAGTQPWVVAHELCLLGKHDLATAYAALVPGSERASLIGYVASRKAKPANHQGLAALVKAAAALPGRDAKATLEAVAGIEPGDDALLDVRLAYARGSALLLSGRVGEAEQALVKAASAGRELGWRKLAAAAWGQAASAARAGLRWPAAKQHLAAALPLIEALELWWPAMQTLKQMAEIEIQTGAFDDAAKHLERMHTLAREHKMPAAEAHALFTKGTLAFNRGDLPSAKERWTRARDVFERLGDIPNAMNALVNLGNIYNSLQEPQKALDCYEKTIPFLEAKQNWRALAITLQSAGNACSQLDRPDEALSHYERAITLSETNGFRELLADIQINAGLAYRAKRDLSEARARLERALAVSTELAYQPAMAVAHNMLSVVLREQGHLAESRTHLEAALKLNDDMGRTQGTVKTLLGLAELAELQGDPETMLARAREGVRVMTDHVRGWSEAMSAAKRQEMTTLYYLGVLGAVETGDTEAFFDLLESSRAQSLVEALGGREAVRAAVMPPALLQEEKAARRAEAQAFQGYRRARERGRLEQVRTAKKAWEAARRRVSTAIADLTTKARSAAAVVYPETVRLPKLQTWLEADEALVAYFVGLPRSWAMVVTRDAARIVPIGDAVGLRALASIDLTRPEPFDEASIEKLRKVLITDLELPKTAKRLLVVPHAFLTYVPISLLAPEREVVELPSATTYGILRAAPETKGTQVLALGDPDYGHQAAQRAKHRSAQRYGTLSPLPGSRLEAKAIGDVVLLGREASETNLRARLAAQHPWRAVHLACHGLVDEEEPSLSSLALATDEQNDGFFTVGDVLRSRVDAGLASLSACETGRGKLVDAEGVLGLARAFMHAGARRVLVSLWKVDDEATRALMIKFYELWNPKEGPGLSAAEALRRAQAHVRQQEAWAHPYYWAAWVLWGRP